MTDGPLVLRFLGVGDSESLAHYNTNLLLARGGRRMLVDCGWTAKRALHDAGLSIGDIEAIFITHVHGDHVFGLERFGFESRYVLHGHRIRLIASRQILHVLWHECLKGCMGYSSEGMNTLEDFFEVCPLDETGGFSWGGERFETFPTLHTQGKPSMGLRLPGCFTYTSDSNVIPDLGHLADGDDCIFHDASLLRRAHPAHATVEEMRKAYPVELRRRIYLVHYEDGVPDDCAPEDFAGIVRQGEEFRWVR